MRELPDDVYRALGRFTWTAMHVEAFINAAAGKILGKEWGYNAQLSTTVDTCLAQLALHPDANGAAEWLKAARDAMSARNEVLHSMPMVTARLSSEGEWIYIGDSISYHSMSKKASPSQPISDRFMQVEVLDDLQAKLAPFAAGIPDIDPGWCLRPGR